MKIGEQNPAPPIMTAAAAGKEDPEEEPEEDPEEEPAPGMAVETTRQDD